MTFQNFKLFSPSEMKRVFDQFPTRTEENKLPSSLQVGQRAKHWVQDGDDPNSAWEPIPCVIMRVEFGTVFPGCGIRYGIGVEIAGSFGWYAVLDGMRGNTTDESVMEFHPERDGLLEIDQNVIAKLKRSTFSVVKGEGLESEAKPRPDLKPVPLNLPSLDLDEPPSK